MPQIDNSRGGRTRARRAKSKRIPPSRSDAAQRTGARSPRPKATPPARPVQRGHASEGGKTISPKTRRRAQRAYEARYRGRSDAAQGRDVERAQEYVRKLWEDYRNGDLIYRDVPPDAYRPGTTVSPQTLARVLAARRRTAQSAQAAARLAPALKVLEQTTRPIHAIAAAAREDVRDVKAGRLPIGHGSLEAAKRGFELKDKSLFSDVLKEAGVPGSIAGPAGFALDVGLDPTTYITGGTSSVARSAAVKAAKRAEARALRAGLTPEQAKRFAERAARQAAKRAAEGRGVSVRVGGREVPGVTRATGAAARGVRRAAPRPVKRAAAGVRHAAADVNPAIVPDGMTRAEYQAVRQAARTARSSTSRGIYKVQRKARAVQKAIGKANYAKVLDAIEAGRIGSLPSDLQPAARFLRDQFKYARRVEKRAGIRGATRKNYVPHLAQDLVEEGRGMGTASVGARRVLPSSSKARKDQRTLAGIRETDPGKYIEDPGVLYAARLSESAIARAKAELNRRLGDLGRTIKPGRTADLKPGEAVFHIRGSDIRQLDLGKSTDRAELQRLVDGSGARGGRYVALNAQAVTRALKTVVPGGERSTIGHAIDKVQGSWKFLATQPNPGFHLRNFAGDLQNAWLAETAPRLARNIKQAGGALRELGREERALTTLGRVVDPSGRGIKINGEKVTYAQIIREAEHTGAIRSGFVSRELDDLMRSGKAPAPSREKTLKRWLQNREDVLRLATYIGGRKRGLTPEEATARASEYHFDYADLTELERKVLRRVMPFYTFSARNIPLQFKALLTHPGKYSQYEKVREELAKAFGYEDGWENDLPEREQRSVPLPVVIDGKRLTLSLGPSGLPLTDLNEFPTTANPIKQADEWLERAASLVTPGIKTPVELWANVSFFFRDQIERDTGPLVPVSTLVVKTVPPRYRERLGIVPDYIDKRTGRRGWAAPAKLVYALGVLPGPMGFLNRVTTVSDRAGQSAEAKAVGYFGLRAIPFDPVSTRIEQLYDDRAKVQKRISALNQRGIYADSATPTWRRLNAREKDLTSHIMALKTQRGDVIHKGGKATGPRWADQAAGATWSDKTKGAKWSK